MAASLLPVNHPDRFAAFATVALTNAAAAVAEFSSNSAKPASQLRSLISSVVMPKSLCWEIRFSDVLIVRVQEVPQV